MYSIDDVRSILEDAKEGVKVRAAQRRCVACLLAWRRLPGPTCRRLIRGRARAPPQETALRELEKHANMAGLVLEQVFAASIIGGLELNIDLSRTEDAGKPVATACRNS